MKITLDPKHYVEGDALQFFIFHDTGKTRSIEANCTDLAGVQTAYCSISPETCSDLNEVVAKDKAVESEIFAMLENKMITRVDLNGGYFIEFDKDAFCLECVRRERTDKSKNFGYFGRWHLKHAVVSYKNRILMHADVDTKEALLLKLEEILAGIKESFTKVELIDQGKPSVAKSRDIKAPKHEVVSSGPKTKFL